MADGHRTYPVNRIVMHHSTGPEFPNSTDKEIQTWFSNIGRTRGYAGLSHSGHFFPGTKTESFSQAQYALHAYTKDGNKYGWRLTQLIDDPWNNVCWHASNWPINQESMGIETCGTYTNKKLPEKALMLVADTFRFKDTELKGQFWINAHNEFISTICPGQITQQIPTIIDMINSPAKWNAKLFPVVKPKPPVEDACDKKLQEAQDDLRAAEEVIEDRESEITGLRSQLAECESNQGGIDEETKDTVKKNNTMLKKLSSMAESIINWLKSFGK